MRIVSETSERDIRVRRVKDALRELAAQIMRIAAGAGDVERVGYALERLNGAIDAMPDRSAILFQREATEALSFATRPQGQYRSNEIEPAIDDVARHALRLVASRYQGLSTQEHHARDGITGAVKWLAEIREKNRARLQPLSRRVPAHLVHLTLDQKQKRALRYLASTESAECETASRPSRVVLAELASAGLAFRSDSPIGYSITKRGCGAYENLLIEEAL